MINVKLFYAEWSRPSVAVKNIINKMQNEFSLINFEYFEYDNDKQAFFKLNDIVNLPTVVIYKDSIEVKRIEGSFLTSPLRKFLIKLK